MFRLDFLFIDFIVFRMIVFRLEKKNRCVYEYNLSLILCLKFNDMLLSCSCLLMHIVHEFIIVMCFIFPIDLN